MMLQNHRLELGSLKTMTTNFIKQFYITKSVEIVSYDITTKKPLISKRKLKKLEPEFFTAPKTLEIAYHLNLCYTVTNDFYRYEVFTYKLKSLQVLSTHLKAWKTSWGLF